MTSMRFTAIFPFAQPVPILDPGIGSQFLAEAHEDHATIFLWPRFQLSFHFFQIQRGERMSEGDDLRELPVHQAVKEAIGVRALDPDVLAGKIDRLVVLNGEIIVIHAVHCEGQLRWRRLLRGIGGGIGIQLPGFAELLYLFVNDGLEPLGGCLNSPFIDVAGNPAAAKALGDGTGCAGADEAVEDEVSGIGCELNDAI